MKNRIGLWIVGVAGVALLPTLAHATITFRQMDDDIFVVSHRVKIIGSRGQAMDLAYTKAAFLCIAAGFTHYTILQQESEASQRDDSANASVRVQFFPSDGEGRIDCARDADPKYIEQAGEKLAKQGYTPPDPAMPKAGGAAEANAEADGLRDHKCSLEQIAAMARAGLADEQIRAACAGGE